MWRREGRLLTDGRIVLPVRLVSGLVGSVRRKLRGLLVVVSLNVVVLVVVLVVVVAGPRGGGLRLVDHRQRLLLIMHLGPLDRLLGRLRHLLLSLRHLRNHTLHHHQWCHLLHTSLIMHRSSHHHHHQATRVLR